MQPFLSLAYKMTSALLTLKRAAMIERNWTASLKTKVPITMIIDFRLTGQLLIDIYQTLGLIFFCPLNLHHFYQHQELDKASISISLALH